MKKAKQSTHAVCKFARACRRFVRIQRCRSVNYHDARYYNRRKIERRASGIFCVARCTRCNEISYEFKVIANTITKRQAQEWYREGDIRYNGTNFAVSRFEAARLGMDW